MQPTGMTALLNVEDMTASLRFYEALGFEVVERLDCGKEVPSWCLLTLGDLRLMLNETSRAASESRRAREDFSDAVFYLYVDDAPAAWSELQSRGVEGRHVGPQDHGLDEVWLRDPDGYHLVVASDV